MNQFRDADDELFGLVAKELSIGRVDPALWAKAFALQDGDERKTKAHYIRLRVEQLIIIKSSTDEEPPSDSEKPPPQASLSVLQEESSAAVDVSATIFPWSRFLARSIDLGVVLLLASLADLSLPLMSSSVLVSMALSMLLFGVVLLAYETLFISVFRTTIGKALFGISVRAADGSRPSLTSAFKRSLWAWIKGNGCYAFFPVATIFTWLAAYKRLKSDGITPWDLCAPTETNQKPIGSGRFIVCTSAAIIILGSFVVIDRLGKNNAKNELQQQVLATSSKTDRIYSPRETSPEKDTTPIAATNQNQTSKLPTESGATFSTVGLRNDGILVASVTNNSVFWKITELHLTMSDADQYVEVLNKQRAAAPYFEYYTFKVDIPLNTSKTLHLPVRWRYERDFFAAADFSGHLDESIKK